MNQRLRRILIRGLRVNNPTLYPMTPMIDNITRHNWQSSFSMFQQSTCGQLRFCIVPSAANMIYASRELKTIQQGW